MKWLLPGCKVPTKMVVTVWPIKFFTIKLALTSSVNIFTLVEFLNGFGCTANFGIFIFFFLAFTVLHFWSMQAPELEIAFVCTKGKPRCAVVGEWMKPISK